MASVCFTLKNSGWTITNNVLTFFQ